MTLKDLANEALNVQNACNLTGVLTSFSRAMSDLRKLVGEDYKQHPIAQIWADKVASLTGIQGNESLVNAYNAVYKEAGR